MALSILEILNAVKDELEDKLVTNGDCSYINFYNGEFDEMELDELRQYNFPAIYITFYDDKPDSAASGTRDILMRFGIMAVVSNFDGINENLYGQEGGIKLAEEINALVDGKEFGLKQKGSDVIRSAGIYIIGVIKEIAAVGIDFEIQRYSELD